jgi:hypothetical protein
MIRTFEKSEQEEIYKYELRKGNFLVGKFYTMKDARDAAKENLKESDFNGFLDIYKVSEIKVMSIKKQ